MSGVLPLQWATARAPAARPVPHPWLVFAVLAAVLLIRQPLDILAPQLNAEEGAIFFQEAYNKGFLGSLFASESGYYHLLLRLTAGLALLGPLELVPFVFKVVALVVQMLPVAYLLADDVVGFVATPALRIAAAALYVAGPNSSETFLNVNNAQWHLTLVACLILLTGPRAGKAKRAADVCVLVLFSLSGPFSAVCAPLALWCWWRNGAAGARRAGTLAPAIVVAGAVVELGYLLSGTRLASGSQFAGATLLEAVRILGLQGALNSLLGMHFTWRHAAEFPAWACVAAAAAIPLLAVVLVRLRNAALLVLGGLAAVSAAVMFVFPLNEPRLWLNPAFGPRYFHFTTLAILYALLALVECGGWERRLAAPLLGIALVIGVRGDFAVPALPDGQWREQIAVFRTLPKGERFYIPIHPHPDWGVTLVRREEAEPLSILTGLDPAGRLLRAALDPVREVNAGTEESMVTFEGFAVDPATGRPAEGVVLVVDGRLYPAVTGVNSLRAVEATNDPGLINAGFSRSVPSSEFGPGLHRVDILARDETGSLLLRAEPLFFRSSSREQAGAEAPA